MSKCKTCISRYSPKTTYPCKYCVENKERHKYLLVLKTIKVKSYYCEAKGSPHDDDLPY